MPRPSHRPVPLLIAAFFALGAVAWAMSNPSGAAPDELAHYSKALGVAGGELAGSPVRLRPADLSALGQLGPEEAARRLADLDRVGGDRAVAWQRKTVREFSIPPDLAARPRCWYGIGPGSEDCLTSLRAGPPHAYVRTYVGTYQPFAYVVPGVATRAANSPESAIRAGRLAAAALCLILVALAVVLTWEGPGGALALVGLVTALTPAFVFTTATINPSGLEIAAALCFGAALLALMRVDQLRRQRAWLAAGVSGVVLASCRSFGPLFVAFAVLALAALAGRDGVRAALRRPRGRAIGTATLIALAAIINWAWEFTLQPQPGLTAADVGPGIANAWGSLSSLGRQAVGVFGTLSITLPSWTYIAWGLLTLLVLSVAFWLGTARERVTLAALVLALLSILVALSVAVRPTGFGVQSRYLLPAFTLLPLAAGEIARRHHRRLPYGVTRIYVLTTFAVVAVVHLEAWYVNASRWAQAGGAELLFAADRFTPPGGWWVWAVVMGAAALSCVVAALIATRCARADAEAVLRADRARVQATPRGEGL